MHRCRLSFAPLLVALLSTALLSGFVCTSTARGQSFGRWHLPSTPAQFFGCGNSGGHHAPMVVTPGCKPPYVPRLAILPQHRRPKKHLMTAPSCAAAADPYFDRGICGCSSCGNRRSVRQTIPPLYHQTFQHRPYAEHQSILQSRSRLASRQSLFCAPVRLASSNLHERTAKHPAQPGPVAKSLSSPKPPEAEGEPKPQAPTRKATGSWEFTRRVSSLV